MKEPDIKARPSEEQIRAHFGTRLKKDTPIERVPYSSVWATADGALLWDAKNGYAGSIETPEKVPKIKCLMYITGPQASGKSTLVHKMQDAVEVTRQSYLSYVDLKRAIDMCAETRELVAVTDMRNDATFERLIRAYADKAKLTYFNINLTRNHNGN